MPIYHDKRRGILQAIVARGIIRTMDPFSPQPPAPAPTPRAPRRGINPLVVSNILIGLIALIFAGLGIWALLGYVDYKNNGDEKIATAVDAAKKDQAEADEAKFIEREKLPTREYVGPEDLGRVSFQYPKTWSAYVAKASASGNYEAYFNPAIVPSVSNDQAFAVRVLIQSDTYDEVIKSYESKVKKGDLASSNVTVNGFSGVRLDGKFSETRNGSAVIFKVRDKTLTVATDKQETKTDYDNTILASLKFNP
jgi:hypothetical protein